MLLEVAAGRGVCALEGACWCCRKVQLKGAVVRAVNVLTDHTPTSSSPQLQGVGVVARGCESGVCAFERAGRGLCALELVPLQGAVGGFRCQSCEAWVLVSGVAAKCLWQRGLWPDGDYAHAVAKRPALGCRQKIAFAIWGLCWQTFLLLNFFLESPSYKQNIVNTKRDGKR